MRCHPRKMSLAACISRWPATTRSPWLAYWLGPRNRSRTDAWASLTWRNRGSSIVATDQQQDVAARPDAAHADHLAGGVDVAELLERMVLLPEGSPVRGEQLLDELLGVVPLRARREQILDRAR